MTRAMSEDLRWRVVRLVVDEGLSTRVAAQRMWVGKSTVGSWVRLFRRTAGVSQMPPQARALTSQGVCLKVMRSRSSVAGVRWDHDRLTLLEGDVRLTEFDGQTVRVHEEVVVREIRVFVVIGRSLRRDSEGVRFSPSWLLPDRPTLGGRNCLRIYTRPQGCSEDRSALSISGT